MAKFIEVTDEGGQKHLINLAWVEDIWDQESGADIYFAFSCPNQIDQDYLRVQESYEEIKRKVGAEDAKRTDL